MILDGGSGCICGLNEMQGCSIELFVVDVSTDRDESGVNICWMSDWGAEMSVIGVKDERESLIMSTQWQGQFGMECVVMVLQE